MSYKLEIKGMEERIIKASLEEVIKRSKQLIRSNMSINKVVVRSLKTNKVKAVIK